MSPLDVAGWTTLGLGFASALAILADETLLGARQHMWIMNLVHPVTALYLGPAWLAAYVLRGRRASVPALEREAARLDAAGADPEALRAQAASTRELPPWQVANAVSHCGAGCTLGDVGGEWIVWASGWTLGAAGAFGPELVLDFVLAWSLGIAFQYFTGQGSLWAAIRADTLSIVAFQLGLFGWMAASHFLLWGAPIDSSGHWLSMQIGMVVGFATAWPVNRLLVQRGWKEPMDVRRHLAMLVEERRGSSSL